MLDRSLERIADRLATDLVTALRNASIEELATLLPAVRRLLDESSRAPAPKRAAPKTVRGSIDTAIVRALGGKAAGLRSEEIQRIVGADGSVVRTSLAGLLSAGRVSRSGQARGTRYTLANAPTEAPAPVVEEPTIDELNAVRAQLVASAAPVSASELETACELGGPRVRTALAKLISLGLAAREGHGAGTRYRLGAQKADSKASPRVVRRPPRAKAWSALEGGDPTAPRGNG